MFPFTMVPFWVAIFDPQPCGGTAVASCNQLEFDSEEETFSHLQLGRNLEMTFPGPFARCHGGRAST